MEEGKKTNLTAQQIVSSPYHKIKNRKSCAQVTEVMTVEILVVITCQMHDQTRSSNIGKKRKMLFGNM